MSKRLNFKQKLRSVTLTRQIVVISLIISLLIIMTYISLGGSRTLKFEQPGPELTTEAEPSKTSIPTNTWNTSNPFPTPTLTPPDTFNITINETNSKEETMSSTIPTRLPTNIPTTGKPWPRPTIFPNPIPENVTIDTETYDPNDLSVKPNKGRNLPNISRYDFIPKIELGFFNQFLSKLNLSLENLLFMFIMFGVIYFPLVGINNMLLQVKKSEEIGENIFFKPSEEQIRKIEARQKRLKSFAHRVEELVQFTKKRRSRFDPRDLVILTYHELDEIFEAFAKLKRARDLTPLEHSQLEFETNEVNNSALMEIVELFYQAQFGKKDLDDIQVEAFVLNLQSLVNHETIKERDEKISRWRLFQ